MSNPALNAKGYPIVKQPAPYSPPKGEPGRDGYPIIKMEVRDFVYVDGKREKVDGPQNVNTDRIEFLFHVRKSIDARQYRAACRLQEDWQVSEIYPTANTVLVGAGGGSGAHGSERKDQAVRDHSLAARALGYDYDLVSLVCEQNLTIEKACASLHICRKVGAGRFWSALHHLADHYGIPRDPMIRLHPSRAHTTP